MSRNLKEFNGGVFGLGGWGDEKAMRRWDKHMGVL